ncbi:MAG: carboxypeptidase-like regulatory domain-containing protein [Hyphomicrobiaceae bacterium]
MRLADNRILRPAWVLALLLIPPSSIACAGETEFEPDDAHEHGAPFFGEAKDIRGMGPLEGVLVRGEVKNSLRMFVIRTDPDGRFRRPGLGADIDADTVTITCEKNGYRTVEVLRRRLPGDTHAPVEVECLLEKQ